jgi:hypothetical protein
MTLPREPDGIENATPNTFAKLTWIFLFLFAWLTEEFLGKRLLSALTQNGGSIFITFGINQDHVCFLIVRKHFSSYFNFFVRSFVTNKIIGSKPINNTIFKLATFTLEMYCGLHFQFRRAHYHSCNTPCVYVIKVVFSLSRWRKFSVLI